MDEGVNGYGFDGMKRRRITAPPQHHSLIGQQAVIDFAAQSLPGLGSSAS
jgi:hypothetical protein